MPSKMRVNIDFHGLSAFVPGADDKSMIVLLVDTPEMHRHEPRLWAQVECLGIGCVSWFQGLGPSGDGFLTASCGFSRSTATIGVAPGSLEKCERGITGQQYPDEPDGDDCFWIPRFADFTTNFAVRKEALEPAPNAYVNARIDIHTGNFVSLRHLTSGGRFSRFQFKSPGFGASEKAFADSVRLVVDTTDPFEIPIRFGPDKKLSPLILTGDANGEAWIAFGNLPLNPSTETDPMTHMPLFTALLPPEPVVTGFPAIDSKNPTFGKTRTGHLNIHTSSCPPVMLAKP